MKIIILNIINIKILIIIIEFELKNKCFKK